MHQPANSERSGAITLEDRHKVELAYHDLVARRTRRDFYAWGALETADRFAVQRMGDVRGLTLLEIGCGTGVNTVDFAARGALVHPTDLSGEMVRVTAERAAAARLAVFPQQMSAEYLAFADASFDAVFGHSVLHHTDLTIARREVARVLKPGGRAVFLEPLDHNPLLNTFRRLTPQRRTPTERPLSVAQLAHFAEPFASLTVHPFYLAALAAWATIPLGSRGLFRSAQGALEGLDARLFASVPRLGRYAWVAVIELTR